MALPPQVIERFPPSPTALLDLARQHVDHSMLLDIANADYGHGAEEALKDLRQIRDRGVFPECLSFNLWEVLELTRYSDPERPNPPPFAPGPTGRPGHVTRLVACATLLRAAVEPSMRYSDISFDSTLVQCLVSSFVLGDEYLEVLARFLTWHFEGCESPELAALALLAIGVQTQSKPFTERELGSLTQFILEQDSARCREHLAWGISEPEPLPFSLMQSFWDPVAARLKNRAATIRDPATREDLELCVLLLDPGW